ncbi:uncharacterized protein LOC123380507 [Felis catus]|uniref:uncharacterized protein LOC123380507 n=1 Tax=Felis catus TaxID=9685 RepID=UPI001D19DF21|nr:uncharacterized protein LOC123380507 [Felis catus]
MFSKIALVWGHSGALGVTPGSKEPECPLQPEVGWQVQKCIFRPRGPGTGPGHRAGYSGVPVILVVTEAHISPEGKSEGAPVSPCEGRPGGLGFALTDRGLPTGLQPKATPGGLEFWRRPGTHCAACLKGSQISNSLRCFSVQWPQQFPETQHNDLGAIHFLESVAKERGIFAVTSLPQRNVGTLSSQSQGFSACYTNAEFDSSGKERSEGPMSRKKTVSSGLPGWYVSPARIVKSSVTIYIWEMTGTSPQPSTAAWMDMGQQMACALGRTQQQKPSADVSVSGLATRQPSGSFFWREAFTWPINQDE